jgi:hypothetical protein
MYCRPLSLSPSNPPFHQHTAASTLLPREHCQGQQRSTHKPRQYRRQNRNLPEPSMLVRSKDLHCRPATSTLLPPEPVKGNRGVRQTKTYLCIDSVQYRRQSQNLFELLDEYVQKVCTVASTLLPPVAAKGNKGVCTDHDSFVRRVRTCECAPHAGPNRRISAPIGAVTIQRHNHLAATITTITTITTIYYDLVRKFNQISSFIMWYRYRGRVPLRSSAQPF